MAISLNACEVAIIPLVLGMAGMSVPSRMYNVLAAGNPIIAATDGNSELAFVVQEEQIGGSLRMVMWTELWESFWKEGRIVTA